MTTARVDFDFDTSAVDFHALMEDYHRDGWCIVPDVLAPELVATLKAEVEGLMQREREAGTAYVYFEEANQRIWELCNKGEIFRRLAQHPLAMQLVGRILAPQRPLPINQQMEVEGRAAQDDVAVPPEFILSSFSANMPGRGSGRPGPLHADQLPIPSPWQYDCTANCVWLIDDFTAENGATQYVPGSHKLGRHLTEQEFAAAETAPMTGKAGSMICWGGQLWHQTGVNSNGASRIGILSYYVRGFMRQSENFVVSADRDTLDGASDLLKNLMGFTPYCGMNYYPHMADLQLWPVEHRV
ncbi:MAG TPA: phytanoyl-CoA dioxygenase family protein [Pseudonocardia sp.]|jgi:ectoine hydroxylase-related dioxygenase (phytanoyl-CoA dioxygenase family)|nr:phytanoyl-CoA dioxygenase family protein [Pseudonocardia sp.]